MPIRHGAKPPYHPQHPALARSASLPFTIDVSESPLTPLEAPDVPLDLALRPGAFAEFQGQPKIREQLELMVDAALQRGDVLEHILLCGPPGLGKTTLAHILAHAMGTTAKCSSGPAIMKAGDLAGLLTTLEKGEVLFIDEIHRLQPAIEEYLYPAMEDYKLDIMIDQGPNARSIRLNLPKFTLIGATTRAGMISAPLRSRFGMVSRLDYYDVETLTGIVQRSAALLDVGIEEEGAREIASRSRGTPRISNNLLRRARDYAQLRAAGVVTAAVADAALTMLNIDRDGLDDMDQRILEALVQRFGGGPVGASSLAVAVGEEPGTLEEVHEPYLIMQGYIQRTSQGRVALPPAYEKLGVQRARKDAAQGSLF